jgi:hypothetical protein
MITSRRGPLTYETVLSKPGGLALIVLNAIGAIVYVFRASPSWAIPQERAAGINSITGEPFVWFAGILPVAAVFFLLNLIWGSLILVRGRWKSGSFWLLAALIWCVAIGIDFAHH